MSRGLKLSGARVLVTGATGGIGQAIARSLKSQGAELILTGRRSDVLDRLGDELGAETAMADLGTRDGVMTLLDLTGPIDVFIAGAGHPGAGRVLELDENELDEIVAVNLRMPMLMARQVAQSMRGRGKGQIVFLGSVGGKVAAGDTAAYNATKFGLRGFSLGLREELRGSGVGVSLVEPGFVREAGMFADSGVRLPPGLRTTPMKHVTGAVIRAIESNPAEVVVAPLELRLGLGFGSIAPEANSWIQRRLGFRLVTDARQGETQSSPVLEV